MAVSITNFTGTLTGSTFKASQLSARDSSGTIAGWMVIVDPESAPTEANDVRWQAVPLPTSIDLGPLSNATLKAYVKDAAGSISQVKTVSGVNASLAQVATPTFSPVAGAISAGTNVTTSSATAGATLYMDAFSPPTTARSSMTVSSSQTLYAKATKAGMADSAVASAAYTVAASGITLAGAGTAGATPSIPAGGVNDVLICVGTGMSGAGWYEIPGTGIWWRRRSGASAPTGVYGQVAAFTGVTTDAAPRLWPATGFTAIAGEFCRNSVGNCYRCVLGGGTVNAEPTSTSTGDIMNGTSRWNYVGPNCPFEAGGPTPSGSVAAGFTVSSDGSAILLASTGYANDPDDYGADFDIADPSSSLITTRAFASKTTSGDTAYLAALRYGIKAASGATGSVTNLDTGIVISGNAAVYVGPLLALKKA